MGGGSNMGQPPGVVMMPELQVRPPGPFPNQPERKRRHPCVAERAEPRPRCTSRLKRHACMPARRYRSPLRTRRHHLAAANPGWGLVIVSVRRSNREEWPGGSADPVDVMRRRRQSSVCLGGRLRGVFLPPLRPVFRFRFCRANARSSARPVHSITPPLSSLPRHCRVRSIA